MARSMSTKPATRSAEHLAQHQFRSPSDTPSPKGKVEQPVGGARLSKSCGIHDDADMPPLRR
jgi:hypothetical protein